MRRDTDFDIVHEVSLASIFSRSVLRSFPVRDRGSVSMSLIGLGINTGSITSARAARLGSLLLTTRPLKPDELSMRFPRPPVTRDQLAILARDNTTDPQSVARLLQDFELEHAGLKEKMPGWLI